MALIGDAKQMNPDWVRGCYFKNYGASIMLGVGVPIPVTSEKVIANCSVIDRNIVAPVIDFSIPRRVRPTFGLVSYEQLQKGHVTIDSQSVRVAPLASKYRSLKVAQELKEWIEAGEFTLTEPVAPLPSDRSFMPQDTNISIISLE